MLIKVRGFELGLSADLVSAFLQESGFTRIYSWSNPEADGEEGVFIFAYPGPNDLEALSFWKRLAELAAAQKRVKIWLVADDQVHP